MQSNETRSNKFSKANPAKDYPFGAVEPEREVTSANMMRDFKARISSIFAARDRAANNENMDFDNPHQPNKTILPNVTGYEKKSIDDTAVFYKGTDQLSEMGLKKNKKV